MKSGTYNCLMNVNVGDSILICISPITGSWLTKNQKADGKIYQCPVVAIERADPNLNHEYVLIISYPERLSFFYRPTLGEVGYRSSIVVRSTAHNRFVHGIIKAPQ